MSPRDSATCRNRGRKQLLPSFRPAAHVWGVRHMGAFIWKAHRLSQQDSIRHSSALHVPSQIIHLSSKWLQRKLNQLGNVIVHHKLHRGCSCGLYFHLLMRSLKSQVRLFCKKFNFHPCAWVAFSWFISFVLQSRKILCSQKLCTFNSYIGVTVLLDNSYPQILNYSLFSVL